MEETRKEEIEVEIETQTKILEEERASFREFQRVETQKEEDSKKQIQEKYDGILKIINNEENPDNIALKEQLQENLNTKFYKRKPFVNSQLHLKIRNSKSKIADLQTELHHINKLTPNV